jgi:hypothetical protein
MANDFNDYIDLMPSLAGATPNDGASFTPIAQGDYEFEIKSVEKGQTKGSEEKPPRPQLVIEFEVVSENEFGKTTRGWYVLDNTSQYHVGRMMSLLASCGVTPDSRGGFSAQGLVGQRIYATIEHEIKDALDNAGNPTQKTYTRLNRERAVQAAAPAPKATAPSAAAGANGPAPSARKGPAANGPAARRP